MYISNYYLRLIQQHYQHYFLQLLIVLVYLLDVFHLDFHYHSILFLHYMLSLLLYVCLLLLFFLLLLYHMILYILLVLALLLYMLFLFRFHILVNYSMYISNHFLYLKLQDHLCYFHLLLIVS